MARINWRSGRQVSAMAVASGLLLAHGAAAAQSADAAAQPVADPVVASTDGSLSDIVVTATRQSESINRVPISIAAFSQESLDTRGLRDINGLARVTPGLSFTPGHLGELSNISIRGISSEIGASTVGIYVDDTPIQSRSLGFLFRNPYPQIFDLERVEVLKGPQGTLFGAGSEGGTVRFITPVPGLERYSAYGRAEVNSVRGGGIGYEAGAAIGGPIIEDKLGFRVSGWFKRGAGWVDRVNAATGSTVDKDSNTSESIVVRGAVTIKPTEDLEITPSLAYQDVDQDDTAQFWGYLSNPHDGRFRNGNPIAQPDSDRFILPGLKIEWTLGDVTLISNTSYFDRKNVANTDYSTYVTEIVSGGAFPLPPTIPDYFARDTVWNRQKAFTQEVRVQSNNDGPLTWVVGTFYSRSKQSAREIIYDPMWDQLLGDVLGCTSEECFGVPLLPGGLDFEAVNSSVDKQIAVFGEARYAVTDTLKLLVGARYARTKFIFSNFQDGPLSGGASGASGSNKEKPFTPKLGVTFEPDGRSLYYATVSKGFRVGGANPQVPADRCGTDLGNLGIATTPTKYNADEVWNYEVGIKKGLFDRRLQANVSAFWIDWKSIQQNIYLPLCGFQYTDNLGKAVSKGFDIELQVRPTPGLTLGANVSYIHSRYTEDVEGGKLVGKGDQLPFPPWTVSLTAEFERPVGRGEAYLFGQYNYSSAYDRLPDAPAAAFDPVVNRLPKVRTVTMRGGYRVGDLDLSLFVDNLFDSGDVTYYRHDVIGSKLEHSTALRPRTIGVTASFRY